MALTDQLIGCWQLEEASGTRFDAWGTNQLTSNNGVTQQTGKLNKCAHFAAASSQYLSHGDNAALSVGGTDFSFAGWLYLDSAPATNICAFSKMKNSSDLEYRLLCLTSSTSALFWQVALSSGSSFTSVTSTFGALSLATWYFVYCEWDNSALKAGISVNAGTLDQSSAAASGPADFTAGFNVGASTSDSPANFWDGRIDELAFWKRKLTSGERTTLYNSGSGLSFINPLPIARPMLAILAQ